MTFEQYYIKHEVTLHITAKYLCSRIRTDFDAEDLMQESAIKAIRFWHHFDRSNFKNWFNKIMRNALIERYKSKTNKLSVLSDSFVDLSGDFGVDYAHKLVSHNLTGYSFVERDELLNLVECLPEPYCYIMLNVIEGGRQKELMRKLDMNGNTLRTKIRIARKLLARFIGERSETESRLNRFVLEDKYGRPVKSLLYKKLVNNYNSRKSVIFQ